MRRIIATVALSLSIVAVPAVSATGAAHAAEKSSVVTSQTANKAVWGWTGVSSKDPQKAVWGWTG